MKTLLTYLAVFTLSFNVFAIDVQEEPKISMTNQTFSAVKAALNQESSHGTQLTNQIVDNHTIPQASNEKPSEMITALSVYLIIIVVYSIYGFKANAKNIRN